MADEALERLSPERAPVYASLVWMVVFSHRLPLEVGMPSALRVLVMSRMRLPRGAAADHDVGGRVQLQPGPLLGPGWDVDLPVTVGDDPEGS